MREEVTIEEMEKLQQTAARVKEKNPWEMFGDTDIICLREGEEADAAFVRFQKQKEDNCSVAVYEGYEGLNDFLMMVMQKELELPKEYVISSQNNMTCNWKNDKPSFVSYAAGYVPYQLNKEEVIRLTHYLELLEESLETYEKQQDEAAFRDGKMYCYSVDSETGETAWRVQVLPFTSFEFENLVLTDEALVNELKTCNRSTYILEIDSNYLGTAYEDERYTRPLNPNICTVCDAKTGMVLRADMIEPEENAGIFLAENVVDFILRFGAPQAIRIKNVILKAALEQLCELAEIKLERLARLDATEKFLAEMEQEG